MIETRTFTAPGRVNLIGEHTDYNGGLVMPAAINFVTTVTLAPTDSHYIQVESKSLNESFEFDLEHLRNFPKSSWTDYIEGVAFILQRAGVALKGAHLLIESTVPLGAGLSSSAALEVSTAYALLARADAPVDPANIALLCQQAENEFVGVRSGIMDQYTSCNARDGHALMLDCRTLEARYLPLPDSVRLVICNTMVKHSLAQGGYNDRRNECEQATHLLGVNFLAELTLEDFARKQYELPDSLRRRARHVISENARVIEAADALENGDLRHFGELMRESHCSLRDDYEVSVEELDLMVQLAEQQEGVYGARMTGGGFGGSTINIVRADAVDKFIPAVRHGYRERTSITPDIYVCRASAGAAILNSRASNALC